MRLLGPLFALVVAALGSWGALDARGQGGSAFNATEGQPSSGQVASVGVGQCASFSDVSKASATIAWGDGTSSAAALTSPNGGVLVVSGSHGYAEEGSYQATVSGSWQCNVDVKTPYPFTASFAVRVADASLQATAARPAAVTVGTAFTARVATFTDSDPAGTAGDYQALIDWGDGTRSLGRVSGAQHAFTVTGTHSYRAPGLHAVGVSIVDRGGAKASLSESVSTGLAVRAPLLLRARPVGNGTAFVRLALPRPGLLTVAQLGRHPRLLLRAVRIHLRRPGPLVVVLRPTALALGLLRRGERLHLTGLVTFTPLGGGVLHLHIPVNLFDLLCDAQLTFAYTGSEQACVVPAGVTQVKVIAVGGHGGSGAGSGGAGGSGVKVTSAPVPVQPGETLYVEVGGNGGDGYLNSQVAGQGAAGAGGWNGGGGGQLPASFAGSGGGGGASDVQTVSCATVCDQGLGLGALFALGSRLVVAGGGGGGGSGGSDGEGGGTTTGGGGGGGGHYGQDAADSGAGSILGGGGSPGTSGHGGGGGTDVDSNGVDLGYGCNPGGDGRLGAGGAGGNDSYFAYADGVFLAGFAGGGGGGGYYGGGGGDGGCNSIGNTIGGGGGGGGGSSFGPPGSTGMADSADEPYVQVIPLG